MTALEKYKKKRNFKKTPEPEGKIKAMARSVKGTKNAKAPIFVIQKHQASHLHYDFRLEHKGVLLSWAVPKGPSLNPADRRLAMQVEDHPYDYKDFEGNIPEGNYGAGTVMVWDYGNYLAMGAGDRAESEKLIGAGMRKGHITFVLNGKKLKGEFALVKMQNDKSSKGNSWMLFKANDDYSKKVDVTKKDKSAQSGKSMAQISKSKKVWQ